MNIAEFTICIKSLPVKLGENVELSIKNDFSSIYKVILHII